jgi:N-acylneuraminate cytidylyltransferase
MAKKSGLFDSIIVSTDSPIIADISISYGASVHIRSARLSDDVTGTLDVVRDCAKIFPYDYACCIYATSPLMSLNDIYFGYHAIMKGYVSHAISIGYPPLRDAAQFYWSTKEALEKKTPYWLRDTVPILVDAERICDINIMGDWHMAETMYAALQANK